jgi:predicted alpha/beta hydrolase family esterase
VRPVRARASRAVAPVIGDILLYQAKGEDIRGVIQEKITKLEDDVFVLAHSLGGIACFELMTERELPNVKGLITAGSQAPLLYELGALTKLRQPARLPSRFPPWLNLCDQNDLLSYCADSECT